MSEREPDPELIRQLIELGDGVDPLEEYRNNPDLQRRVAEVMVLRERLDQQAELSRVVLEESLQTAAPGEDRVREWLLGHAAGQDSQEANRASPERGRRLWAAAAAAVVVLGWFAWWLQSRTDEAPGVVEGPVDVLSGKPGALELLPPSDAAGFFAVLEWQPIEGLDVTYDLSVWAANDQGGVLDRSTPLVKQSELESPRWLNPDPSSWPAKVVVLVEAFEGDLQLDVSPLQPLSRVSGTANPKD